MVTVSAGGETLIGSTTRDGSCLGRFLAAHQ